MCRLTLKPFWGRTENVQTTSAICHEYSHTMAWYEPKDVAVTGLLIITSCVWHLFIARFVYKTQRDESH
jgi:hypothetical protein